MCVSVIEGLLFLFTIFHVIPVTFALYSTRGSLFVIASISVILRSTFVKVHMRLPIVFLISIDIKKKSRCSESLSCDAHYMLAK